jgi:class 3 adenylate cyclase
VTEDQIVRKIAVIFVTDVVSFSTLMEKNENSTLISLRACRQIMNQLFKNIDARIFNTAGDSVLAEFQSAVSAVICAAEFQQMISKRNLSVSKDLQMQFRVGLNVGDVIVEGTNLYGEGVNNAARLEALSQAGGVSLSKSIYDFVNKKVEFDFTDLGTQKIKNTVLHAYDLIIEGLEPRILGSSIESSEIMKVSHQQLL